MLFFTFLLMVNMILFIVFFFFQAEDGIRDKLVTGVQTWLFRSYDLCLTDMRLPDGDGLELLKYIAENHGNTPVAVITAYGSTENAVQALKAGAFDYLAKPIKLEQLRPLVTSALKLPRPVQARRAAIGETMSGGTPRLLGESPAIARAR